MNDITTLLKSLPLHVAVQFARECSLRAVAAYTGNADRRKRADDLVARAVVRAIDAADHARSDSSVDDAANAAAHAVTAVTRAGGDADDERAWQVARLRELIDAKEDEK